MPIAAINGTGLFYAEQGQGDPIIFHHGYTGSHDSWDVVVPAFADRHRCIVMDCRGAGDSERPADGHTMEQYAADVIALADHLGEERFTFVGHSMGGAIGMQLGLAYPERLEKLVLVAPAPADGIDMGNETNPAMAAMRERARRLWAAKDRETLLRERLATTARPNPAYIEKAVDRALSVSEAHYDQSWDALRDFRVGARLGEIQTPTLVVAGAADGLLPANLDDFRRLGNATLHVFSRVSHGIHQEEPAGFIAVLADFLEHGVVTQAVLQARLREQYAASR